MGVGRVRQHELDDFVAGCDERGGLKSAACVEWMSDFEYVLDTRVDERLDPFSEAYVEEQLAVYRELSGRELDQEQHEQTPFDFDASLRGANPYGSDDPSFLVPHAVAVLHSLYLAELPPSPRVLDMGCGWGLSTELMGFCGARLTCVDVNPDFLRLVRERAAARGLDVRTVQAEFESFESDEQGYDMAIFYECLHHTVRPWRALENVARAVADDGKIVLSGEPIQSTWWRTWGLRLDPASVYSTRKHGWFESGFSRSFLRRCFERCGRRVQMYPGLGLGLGYVAVSGQGAPSSLWPDEARVVAATWQAARMTRRLRREIGQPRTLVRRVLERLR